MYTIMLITSPQRRIFRGVVGEYVIATFIFDDGRAVIKLYKPGLNFEKDNLDIIPVPRVDTITMTKDEYNHIASKFKKNRLLFNWALEMLE